MASKSATSARTPAGSHLYACGKCLTTEEQQANDQFLPSCSRARSALLVLDL